jgi:DNA-binding MarR family transcriptional regulator
VATEELIDRIDRTLMRMRRLAIKPVPNDVNLVEGEQHLSHGKMLACTLLADIQQNREGAISIKDVAAFLDLEHSTASRLMSELEADGLIERGVDPEDRRRTTIALTPAGLAAVDGLTEVRRWVMQRVLDGWDTAELDRLVHDLERVIDQFHVRLPDAIRAAQDHFKLP